MMNRLRQYWHELTADCRKGLLLLGLPGLVFLSACGEDPAPAAPADPAPSAMPSAASSTPPALRQGDIGLAEGFAPIAFDLHGTAWLVTAIDGQSLSERYTDLATIHFTRSMLYWQGCNHREALYLPITDSFLTMGSGLSTLANCPVESPDAILTSILTGRPLIGRNREGKLMLATQDHSVTMSEMDTRYRDTPPAPFGGSYVLRMGGLLAPLPVLSIRGATFAIWLDCADAITGDLHFTGDSLRLTNVRRNSCDSFRPTATSALAGFFTGTLAIARGPNGEIMLSDGQQVATGRQCYPDDTPCRHAKAIPANADGE